MVQFCYLFLEPNCEDMPTLHYYYSLIGKDGTMPNLVAKENVIDER